MTCPCTSKECFGISEKNGQKFCDYYQRYIIEMNSKCTGDMYK